MSLAAALAMMMSNAAPGAIAYAEVDPAVEISNGASAVQPSPAASPAEATATMPVGPAEPTPAPASVDGTRGDNNGPPIASPAPIDATAQAEPMASDAPENAIPSPIEDDQSVIVVEGSPSHAPGDPLERINAQSFEILQSLDGAIIEPVGKIYNKGIPRPVRQGLRNFFSNLDEPVVFVAYMLQFKPVSAMKTVGRFTINSTLGIAGLIDMAKRKPFHLPYKPNGLANTLGFYGIGPGPYMYLPIIGPTTLRDIIGNTVDIMFQPLAIGGPFTKPAFTGSTTVLDQLGERAAFDERISQIRKEGDPYAAYRDLYLKQRQAEIDALHGRQTSDIVPVYGLGLRTPGKRQEIDPPVDGKPQKDQQHELN